VYAQTTYKQENLAFCFQLCTVAHFVGFLLLPWFSSLTADLADFLCQLKTFKIIFVSPPLPAIPRHFKVFLEELRNLFPSLWRNWTGFCLEDSIFMSVKQPAPVQRFCEILEVCNGRFLFTYLS
jgi:hypothetical protein